MDQSGKKSARSFVELGFKSERENMLKFPCRVCNYIGTFSLHRRLILFCNDVQQFIYIYLLSTGSKCTENDKLTLIILIMKRQSNRSRITIN